MVGSHAGVSPRPAFRVTASGFDLPARVHQGSVDPLTGAFFRSVEKGRTADSVAISAHQGTAPLECARSAREMAASPFLGCPRVGREGCYDST